MRDRVRTLTRHTGSAASVAGVGVRAKQAIVVAVVLTALVAAYVLSPEGDAETDADAEVIVNHVERYHDDDSAKGLTRAFQDADPDVRVLTATDLDKIESSADPTVRVVFRLHYDGVEARWMFQRDVPPRDVCYEVVFTGQHAAAPERVLCWW
jgi:type IV secretory pathway VirB10-like protein